MFFPPNRQTRNRMPRNDLMFPRQGYRQMPPQQNPIGGLLQRFMGPNQNVGQMATRGVEGLSKTLNNVQQVLRVVDTAAPIVKQYGPLVRNLPAMYRMMKAFKDINDDEKSTDSEELESLPLESEIESSYDELEFYSQEQKGQSKPRLFI